MRALGISDDGNYIYAGDSLGDLYSVHADTGEVRWQSEHEWGGTIRSITTHPDNEKLFVGSNDADLLAIDAETGGVLWENTDAYGATAGTTISSTGDAVYSGDTGTYAALIEYDPESGETRWRNPDDITGRLYSLEILQDDQTLIAGSSGGISAYDATDGSPMWNVRSEEYDGADVRAVTVAEPAAPSGDISGQVVTQDGDAVPDATVEAWGIRETVFDEEQIDDLEQEIRALDELIENPIPDVWNDSLDPDSGSGLTDGEAAYVAVHDDADAFGTGWSPNPNLENPTINPSAEQTITLSVWDPTDVGFWKTPAERQLLGSPIQRNIVLERYGPDGSVVDDHTIEPDESQEFGGIISSTTHHWAETELQAGVYHVYPEGSRETGYPIMVGSEGEIAGAVTGDLMDTRLDLEGQLEKFIDEIDLREDSTVEELFEQGVAVRERTATDANGNYAMEIDSDVRTVSVHAYKADREVLDIIDGLVERDDPSFEDIRMSELRDAVENDYNGSVYLPSDSITAEPPEDGVDIELHRVDFGPPYTTPELLDLLREYLTNEQLDELIAELGGWDQLLQEMDDEQLLELWEALTGSIDGNQGIIDLIEEETGVIIDPEEDGTEKTREELEEELESIRDTLDEIKDELDIGDGEIEIGDETIEIAWPVPDWVDLDDVAVLMHTSDGETHAVNEEYIDVRQGGLFGSKEVVIEFPADELDSAIVDFELKIIGENEDQIGSGNAPVENPAFGGTIPQIDAVNFNTLAPGGSERIHATIDAPLDGGYGSLVSVEAFDPQNNELEVDLDEDRDRASFNADGVGIHTVRFTFESTSGDEFTITERIRAGEHSRSDPATVRASNSVLGTHAVVGEELSSARIDTSGDVIRIEALVDSADDAPGELHVQPDAALSGSENTLEVAILHGSDEREIRNHVQVYVHLESVDEDTLFWSNGHAVTHDGDTRFGEVMDRNDGEKHILVTFTDERGSVSVDINTDPEWYDRISHWMNRTLPSWSDVPFVGGMLVSLLEFVGTIGAETVSTVSATTPTTVAPTGAVA